MIETTNMLKELYRVFDAINDKYFEGSLPKIFITLQQGKKKTKSIYGAFFPKSWAENQGVEYDEETGTEQIKTNEDRFHEIAMSAEYFTRPVANWCSTLCHEMVHLYCQVNNLQDTSNNNVYHNKTFKIEAEKRGLIIEKADTIGWSVTTPSTDFIKFIEEEVKVDEEVFKFFRDTKLNPSKVTPKKRYICPLCGTQVQAKKKKNIICGDCEKRMDYVDITDPMNPDFIEDYNDGLAEREGWASYTEGNEDEPTEDDDEEKGEYE